MSTVGRSSLWMICDRVLAVALIILGLGQIAATPFFFPIIHEPAVWFGAGGFLLSLIGALNLLRIRYGMRARGVVWVSIGANFIIAAMWIAMAALMLYKFKRYPASFVALGIIATAAAISILNDRGALDLDDPVTGHNPKFPHQG